MTQRLNSNDGQGHPGVGVRFRSAELHDVAAVAVLFGAGFFVLNLQFLPETLPNPLWVPVLVASACFGVPVGLLSVIAATGLTMLAGPNAPLGAADFYSDWLATWTDPALWVIVAIWIGSMRQYQVREAAGLRRQCALLTEKVGVIQSYADQLSRHSRDLERQIVTSALPATGNVIEAVLAFRNQASPVRDRVHHLCAELLGKGRYELTVVDRGQKDVGPGSSLGQRQGAPKRQAENIVPLFGSTDTDAVSSSPRYVCELTAPGTDRLLGHLTIADIGPEWSHDIDVILRLIVSEVGLALAAQTPNRSGDLVLPGSVGPEAREPARHAVVERH